MDIPSSPSSDSDHKKYVQSLSGEARESYDKGRRAGEILGHIWSNREAFKEAAREKFEADLRARSAEWQANHDELTGLLNRGGWYPQVEKKIAGAKDGEIGVLFIDLGNFKWVNDTLGHDEGDKTLKKVAAVLEKATRDKEPIARGDLTPARLGGDEFGILLELKPRDDHPETEQLTPEERLHGAVERFTDVWSSAFEEDPVLKGSPFNAAIGGAVWHEGMTADQLVKAADESMFQDKTQQRSQHGAYRETTTT